MPYNRNNKRNPSLQKMEIQQSGRETCNWEGSRGWAWEQSWLASLLLRRAYSHCPLSACNDCPFGVDSGWRAGTPFLPSAMSLLYFTYQNQPNSLFLLKHSQFTMLCQFQMNSKVMLFILFHIFSIIGYYKILNRVSCAIQQVLVAYLLYNSSVYMLTPNLLFIPPCSFLLW